MNRKTDYRISLLLGLLLLVLTGCLPSRGCGRHAYPHPYLVAGRGRTIADSISSLRC